MRGRRPASWMPLDEFPDAAAQDCEGVDAPSPADVPLPPASHDHHDVEGKDGLRVWSRAAPAAEPEVRTTQLDVIGQREKKMGGSTLDAARHRLMERDGLPLNLNPEGHLNALWRRA